MEEFIKYIGMDVHGKTIAVAVAGRAKCTLSVRS